MSSVVTPREIEALKELANRKCDTLDIFRPLANQEPFFLSRGTEVILRGGNRCSAKGTTLWACVPSVANSEWAKRSKGPKAVKDFRPVRIEDIRVGEGVAGVVRKKRIDIRLATVESKSEFSEEGYELTTKRGYSMIGTHDHPVLACPPLPPRYNNSVDPDYKNFQWVKLSDLKNLDGWYVQMAFGSYVDWEGEIDQDAYDHGLMDGDGSVEVYKYGVCKLSGHKDESLIPAMQERLTDKGIHSRVFKQSENGVSLEWCNLDHKKDYMAWQPEWNASEIAGYIRGVMDADGCVSKEGKIILVQTDAKEKNRTLIRWIHDQLLLFGIRSSLHKQRAGWGRPNPAWRLTISGYSVKRYHKSIGFNEEEKKKKLDAVVGGKRQPPCGKLWWERVKSVKKCGDTGFVAISTSTESYISNGIVSHNSGKSTCVASKFAAIARDKPIILRDGRKVNMRRKYQRGKCLTMWIIAYDSKYIGQTIHRLLFQPGMFRITRDLETGEWVTYNQNNQDHASRPEDVTDAPPLIPESWVVPGSWDWENLGNREFNRVDIANPQTGEKLAEIFAYSSKGDPKAGDPVDHIWIDEKIRYPRHYPEWQARILDRKGRIDWSSWPAMGNQALTNLSKRAKKCRETGDTRADEIVIRTDDNEFFDKEEFKSWAAGFSTEGEYLARVCGEYQTDGLKMYPLFSKDICSAVIVGGKEDELSKAIRSNSMEPPSDWTRELILDPGTANPAVLFCAIPPPQFGDYFVVYDEICIPRLDAKQLAKKIKEKMAGNSFHRFIIDGHAGRTTPMGFGITVQDNYSKEFEAAGIYCESTGSQFTYGSDNVAGRIQVLSEWMHIQASTGLPKLRIVTHRCPTLCEQLSEYEKDMVADVVQDFKPAKGQRIDAAVALEYFASRMPKYVPPRVVDKEAETMQTLWEKMKKMYFNKGKSTDDSETVVMGPPT